MKARWAAKGVWVDLFHALVRGRAAPRRADRQLRREGAPLGVRRERGSAISPSAARGGRSTKIQPPLPPHRLDAALCDAGWTVPGHPAPEQFMFRGARARSCRDRSSAGRRYPRSVKSADRKFPTRERAVFVTSEPSEILSERKHHCDLALLMTAASLQGSRMSAGPKWLRVGR